MSPLIRPRPLAGAALLLLAFGSAALYARSAVRLTLSSVGPCPAVPHAGVAAAA